MSKENKSSSEIKTVTKATLAKKKPGTLPKTVQQTIPYKDAYENGVLQVGNGVFTKLFEFDDIPFKTQSDERQEEIYDAYMKFLNSIQPKEDIWFYFVNMREDAKDRLERISPIMRGDRYDVYRKEMTDMLRNKMATARNNITTKKYMLIRVEDDSVDKAMQRLSTLSAEMESIFRRITKHPLKALNLAERLELMNIILNSDEKNYWFEHDANGHVSVDFKRMAKQGLTTKDIISPMSMKFNSNNFEIGERLGQSMLLENIANWMNTNFLSDLTDVNFECVIAMSIKSIPQTEGLKMVHNQSVNITAEVMQKQKGAMEGGFNPEFISADLKNAKNQIDALQEDMLNRDQKLFYSTVVLTHFAENKDLLKEHSNIIKNVGSKHMCAIRPLVMQQERGFCTSLPMGLNKLFADRLLTTESLGIFMPFNEAVQFDEGGFYYGINSVNKSMIVYNRLKGMNYNALVLGSSGSGKSFSAKREMISALLNTNADVFIIDPDGEYGTIADAFNGSVIKIAPGNHVNINPLDLDIDQSADSDLNPLTMKTDFVKGLLETMIGHGAQLTPPQKSIVDRCVQLMYRNYIAHLHDMPIGPDGRRPTIDKSSCPTLQNLFDLLLEQPQPEAQQLALVMETYTTGSFDTFAHRTNVDTDARLVIYDIQDIGSNLKELGLKVCLNDVWNRMIANRRKGKWTFFYIDEFHLLMSNPSTSEFIKTVWKRARKFQGVPTGITQNVEDLLQSPDARAVINNTSFTMMLNQSAMDRGALAELLQLSENDLEYITNAEPGHGLIHTGKQTIPFEDDFPKDTQLYKIMSTTPTDSKS